jgi:hypothetical protein
VKGPPVINYTKEKKKNSNRVKTYNSESYFKGQSHFLQLKSICIETSKNSLEFSFKKDAN